MQTPSLKSHSQGLRGHHRDYPGKPVPCSLGYFRVWWRCFWLLGFPGLQLTPKNWNMNVGRSVLGFPLSSIRGWWTVMFKLAGFCCKVICPSLWGSKQPNVGPPYCFAYLEPQGQSSLLHIIRDIGEKPQSSTVRNFGPRPHLGDLRKRQCMLLGLNITLQRPA